jgi:hypothetical protein
MDLADVDEEVRIQNQRPVTEVEVAFRNEKSGKIENPDDSVVVSSRRG